MKWILMIVLFCVCVGVGFLTSTKYKRKLAFFTSLIMLAQKLDVEINFSRERLKKLIENFDQKAKGSLFGIDKNFLDYLENGRDLTSEKLFGKNNLIKIEDKEVVTMFFRSLGRSDVENQTKEIKNAISRFEILQQNASAENKKYGSLGTKLGIIAGLAIAILLI